MRLFALFLSKLLAASLPLPVRPLRAANAQACGGLGQEVRPGAWDWKWPLGGGACGAGCTLSPQRCGEPSTVVTAAAASRR
jgi:hypothetical protein